MKNVEIPSVIGQYNKKMENSNEIYDYMKVNIIHLEEDIARFTRKGYSQSQLQKLTDLHKVCISIQDKVTYHRQLSENEIKAFEEINLYNTAKNTEMKRLVFLTIFIVIIGIVITLFIK